MNDSNYQFALALTKFIADFHAGKLKHPEDAAVELDKLAALAWSDVRSLPLPVVLPEAEISDSASQQ